MNIKKAIAHMKTDARKSKASITLLAALQSHDNVIRCDNEKAFLGLDFKKVKSFEDLMTIVHSVRHKGLSKAGRYTRCKLCKKIAEEIADILPRMGNLLAILEQEEQQEKATVEAKRMPSQNDLTRWALKKAVLEYYQGFNYPPDKPIVMSRFDDRLIDELAPDFDVIARIWFQKLDELKQRNDRYTLNMHEEDRAEEDLLDGMRGSAFEKQLDRFRIEFMSKLPR
jgi:hypothetical protein